jgi:hypothetical protein
MVRCLVMLSLMLLSSLGFSQKDDAELVNQEADVLIKNGKLYNTLTYEIKINNRSGERFTKVSLPYSKMVKISGLEAYIKDFTGTIVKRLQKSDVTDKSAIADGTLYADEFVKEFTLKHNVYPYSIVYSYHYQADEFINIINWMPVVSMDIPTKKARLRLEVPVDYKILYQSQFIDTFRVDTVLPVIKYSWEASYTCIKKAEIYSPPFISFMPEVEIVPVSFKFDQHGSFDSWLSFGNWNYELQKGLSPLPQNEIIKIHSIIDGISDTGEKVKKLYHYLQDNTRYINITIETGGLKPYSASYVSENKYGDCKALSNYFKAVLEIAGIKSYYVLVKAGDPKTKINKDFPSQQFNHIIVCTPIENDTIWLDCTSDLPYNLLGTFTQDRDVFLIEKDQSHFVRTPALSKIDVNETRTVKISLFGLNKAVASFRNSYGGSKYESFLYLSHSVNETEKAKIFRNYFVEDGFELLDFTIADPNRDSSRIFLTYSGKTDKAYKNYGTDIIIEVLPFYIPAFEDPKNRLLPVQIDYPVNKTDTLEYEIPTGYSVKGVLRNEAIDTEFGTYRIRSVKNGRKIEIVKNFHLHPGSYPIDRYGDFYSFIRKVSDIEKNDKILTAK